MKRASTTSTRKEEEANRAKLLSAFDDIDKDLQQQQQEADNNTSSSSSFTPPISPINNRTNARKQVVVSADVKLNFDEQSLDFFPTSTTDFEHYDVDEIDGMLLFYLLLCVDSIRFNR